MIVLSSEGRTVFIGTLEKWKKGKGEAEDKLTIMSLKGLTMPGDTPKKEKITVLCWNYLSERARKLNVGDVVTVQVAFEAGNSRRGTAERFPKSGLFLTKTRQRLQFLNRIGLISTESELIFLRFVIVTIPVFKWICSCATLNSLPYLVSISWQVLTRTSCMEYSGNVSPVPTTFPLRTG